MKDMASSTSPEHGLLAEDRDVALRALIEHPLTLTAPARWTAPFIFSSPHSGAAYTPSFVASTRLDPLALRRSEDAFVDELFSAAPLNGAYLLSARFPRAYVDVNRADSELDPAMFEGSAGVRGPASARVAAGLGVIPKVVRDGMEIYGKRLPASEAAFRLDAFYRPYHAALARLLAQGKAVFGHAILIDCHSMPPVAKGYDIVIGDRHGSACASSLSAMIESLLRAEGFTVGRNHPYAGGFTTSHYGRPSEGVHAVQIEINRALYLDEKKIQKAPGFAACHDTLSRFIGRLTAMPAL